MIAASLPAVLASLMAGCPGTDGDVEAGLDAATVDAGSPGSSNTSAAGGQAAGPDGFTAAQKLRAEQITSIFENDTLELQYAYIEALGDGRGYTAGRAGFTTATADLLIVVERYTEVAPGTELAAFLPRLRVLAEIGSESISGLSGLPSAWERASDDAVFRSIQDGVVDEMYYQPAVRRWREVGLTTALSLAALYDANIQHGEGDDPDGLPAMIERASERAGGTVKGGVTEAAWLDAFLAVRQATLEHASDPATRAEWAAGSDRVDAFRALLTAGNFNLAGPFEVKTRNHEAIIP